MYVSPVSKCEYLYIAFIFPKQLALENHGPLDREIMAMPHPKTDVFAEAKTKRQVLQHNDGKKLYFSFICLCYFWW